MFGKIKKFFKNDDAESRVKLSLYGRVWREIGRPHVWGLIVGVIFMLIAVGAEAYSITLVKQGIDYGFISKDLTFIYILGLQIIAAFFVKSAFAYANTLVMAKVGLNAGTKLRRRIYAHMLKQDMGEFKRSNSGKIMNYFGLQAGAVLNLITGTLISFIRDTATMLIMFGVMVYYAAPLSAILLVIIPLVIYPMIIILRKQAKNTRKTFGIAANSASWVMQSMQGIKTIQGYNAEEASNKRMGKIEDDAIHLAYKSTQLSGIRSPIMEVMIGVALALSLAVGGIFIVNGSMSVGDFTAFLLALTAAYKPAKKISGVGGGIQTGILAAEVLFDFLDTKPGIRDKKDAKILDAKNGMSVEFEHAGFSYHDDPDRKILDDINLSVKSGQMCALVGASGGGKTTIVNLLARFYDVSEGAIKINGADIRDYTLESLRGNIAEVSQDVFLFDGTIADNIKFGKPEATAEEIAEAARVANVAEFVDKMPDKYDTMIGERGVMLSGGQRQRVAIARAVLKNAPLLLLDEATSALDTRSERMVQEALAKLMKGRTTFVVAHRLSTIVNSDIICVIKQGQIVEQGTDEELMAEGGEYAALKQMQLAKKDKPADTEQ
ncbi:MAG: ATP-binding cassette domain-containing protein [Rickettsiales bacterium]|jgi:subfamily B ATP-binding cassette protein MsbA|nr:ATP-binding cassette domain-containing protein [Rickettsiales bacterium]